MKLKLTLALFLLPPYCFGDINLGFESGQLTGWLTGGTVQNAQVLSALGPFTPPEGAYFALLSNGPGQVNDPSVAPDVATLISPPLQVLSAGATLTFWFDFLSAEPNDGSGYPDSFAVLVLGNPATTIVSGSITSGQIEIPGGPVTAPDGTTLVYHDGWRHFSIPMGIYDGQTIRIEFEVGDAIDNSFDSALLIDGIQGVGMSPIPEPSSILLIGAVAALLGRRLYVLIERAGRL